MDSHDKKLVEKKINAIVALLDRARLDWHDQQKAAILEHSRKSRERRAKLDERHGQTMLMQQKLLRQARPKNERRKPNDAIQSATLDNLPKTQAHQKVLDEAAHRKQIQHKRVRNGHRPVWGSNAVRSTTNEGRLPAMARDEDKKHMKNETEAHKNAGLAVCSKGRKPVGRSRGPVTRRGYEMPDLSALHMVIGNSAINTTTDHNLAELKKMSRSNDNYN
ncbi:hypothetical protein SeMB42_g05065 [Synchytrium endobioticum]|uniref:Uncharacterized protein n=1 Tax=Synchytrium endobioticum TaxID=286115 RepID=A0A507CTX4_9FUNG|nr:hypothetical protein SeMB42_g05065 [Synchytrium endobioticum]